MKDPNKINIKVTEGGLGTLADKELQENSRLRLEKLKKPMIYFLMAIVCAGCLYLIFKPKDKITTGNASFNATIPQAGDDKLQSDKQKAYEQQLLEQKNEEKRNALTSLSDYWNDSSSTIQSIDKGLNVNPIDEPGSIVAADQNGASSYRNAQQALGSFYSRDDQEVNSLKREISRLKSESFQKETVPKGTGINDQLELMEKSYQMAAKYLPITVSQEKPEEKKILNKKPGRIKCM